MGVVKSERGNQHATTILPYLRSHYYASDSEDELITEHELNGGCWAPARPVPGCGEGWGSFVKLDSKISLADRQELDEQAVKT